MNNNDILRRLRYALDLSDPYVRACFAASAVDVAPQRLSSFWKREDAPGFELLPDDLLGAFLDGWVEQRRGKRADGATSPKPAMNNNRVLRSIKIALELRDADIIEIMSLGGSPVSKGQVSALFRREGHPNYYPCGDQFLRYFLRGLTLKCRGAVEPGSTEG